MNARLSVRKGRLWPATVLAGAALCACHPKVAVQGAPQAGDLAVARVNGSPVWASEVRREVIAQGLATADLPLPPGSEPFRRVLDEVIDRRLLAADAVHRGLDRSPEARRRLEAARDQVLSDLALEAVQKQAVTPAAVGALYQAVVRNQPAGQPPPSLEEARPQIIRFLTFDQVKDTLLNLRRDAKIEILLPQFAPTPPPTTPSPRTSP